jgi:hypothetical protein
MRLFIFEILFTFGLIFYTQSFLIWYEMKVCYVKLNNILEMLFMFDGV